jgi:outer membrane protein assembly factor BamB
MDKIRAAPVVEAGSRQTRRGPRGKGARQLGRIIAAIGLIGASGVSLENQSIDAGDILGTRPSYGPAVTGSVPNLAAIDRLIWVPGLDAGWNPQGLAVARGSLLVSAYRSGRFDRYRGPCRVFRLDPGTGRETGRFDVPPPCGHAGGLAYAGDGVLYIADTRTLFAVALDAAFAATPPKFRSFPLRRGVGGGLASSGRDAVWLGTYSEGRGGKIFEFRAAALDTLEVGAPLEAKYAARQLAIPSHAQGGAIDSGGSLWIARSDIAWGSLDKLDPATGQVEARYPAPGGIEGIAFEPSGRLWAVSEAGSRHMPLRYPFFPLVFRLDLVRLRPGG